MTVSEDLFKQAQKCIPGGVNSPVRAYGAVGGVPKFMDRAKGAFIWDVDGNKYLDFVMSWGPLIFGHADTGVVQELKRQAEKGTSFGASTESEVRLAQLITSAFPSMDQVRLVSSGTEAVMSAIRLARGTTNRKRIIKCDGGYHGHTDSLLIQAGSGMAQHGIPGSRGVPEELARLTFSIPFNDTGALSEALKQYGDEVACFILEPVPGNMGLVLPKPGYLDKVRELTKAHKVLLIFDEVISGFRVAFGGAQALFDVTPDLTCLGKILGGGLPIGAFGGNENIMKQLAPQGDVYQAGTLSGNPLATAVGIETLTRLQENNFYSKLNEKSDRFMKKLIDVFKDKSFPVSVNHLGSGFTIFFTESEVSDYVSAKNSDTRQYAHFFHHLLQLGIYFTPSQFEANFVSAAHTTKDLDRAADVIVEALEKTFSDNLSSVTPAKAGDEGPRSPLSWG